MRIIECKKLQEKAEPIGRNLMSKVGSCLSSMNNYHAVEIRACFNSDFNCCGRTGEIDTASYGAAAYWDDVQRTLKTDWSMKKVAEYKSSIQIKNVCIPLYCILNDLLK